MGRRRRSILQDLFALGGRPPWWATALLALGIYALMHRYAASNPVAAADAMGLPGAVLANALRHVAAYAQYVVPWMLLVGMLTSVIRRAARTQLSSR